MRLHYAGDDDDDDDDADGTTAMPPAASSSAMPASFIFAQDAMEAAAVVDTKARMAVVYFYPDFMIYGHYVTYDSSLISVDTDNVSGRRVMCWFCPSLDMLWLFFLETFTVVPVECAPRGGLLIGVGKT